MNLATLSRKLPFLGRSVDERFLRHRLHSTSLAGIVGGVSAIALFSWRFYVNHIWSWDLFAIVMVIVGVKLSMMLWYIITD